MNKTSGVINPLVILIALIGVIEIGFGVGLTGATDVLQTPIVVIMTILAVAILVPFWITLWTTPHLFYAPRDYYTDEAYLEMNSRVDRLDKLSQRIDEKIETLPFYRYSKLSEPAIRLFLASYRELEEGTARTVEQVAQGLEPKFSASQIQTAIGELVSAEWLAREGSTISTTEQGRDAFGLLRQFVYSRIG